MELDTAVLSWHTGQSEILLTSVISQSYHFHLRQEEDSTLQIHCPYQENRFINL